MFLFPRMKVFYFGVIRFISCVMLWACCWIFVPAGGMGEGGSDAVTSPRPSWWLSRRSCCSWVLAAGPGRVGTERPAERGQHTLWNINDLLKRRTQPPPRYLSLPPSSHLPPCCSFPLSLSVSPPLRLPLSPSSSPSLSLSLFLPLSLSPSSSPSLSLSGGLWDCVMSY